MAYVIADGVPGLEGVHTWGSLVLNDLTAALPYVRLSEIDGLHDLPDADDLQDDRTGRLGTLSRPGFARSKTVVYVGTVFAANREGLRAYCNAIRAAFSERAYEHTMTVGPPPGDGGISWTYNARVVALSLPEKQEAASGALPSPWQRTLTLTLRLSDPRFYTGSNTAGTFAGGASTTVTNAGTAPTEPTFTVPVTSGNAIVIENTSVTTPAGHATLSFAASHTGTMTIDFATRSAYVTASGVKYDSVNGMSGDWWDAHVDGLRVGTNTVTLGGASGWSFTWKDASW